tara:strand:+ start:83 stop:646 length:564 start_codon:yes stop_codon:yes gene_type:complete
MSQSLFFPNARLALFDVITKRLLAKGGLLISGTKKGMTQASGTKAEEKVKEVLDELNLYSERAPYQHHRDFRNIGNIGLDIEVKKSDKGIIKCNDTRPPEDVFYIVFLYQSSTKKSKNKPCIWFGTGDELCGHPELEALRQVNIAMANARKIAKSSKGLGNLKLYPRYNWDVNCTGLSGKIELDLEQ